MTTVHDYADTPNFKILEKYTDRRVTIRYVLRLVVAVAILWEMGISSVMSLQYNHAFPCQIMCGIS